MMFFFPSRAAATIFLPRVTYPPSPSARQLLSPYPPAAHQVFIPIRASATILPSAHQVCVRLPPLPVRASALPQLLFALPSLLRVRFRERQVPPNPNPPTSPSAWRQLLFALPCVRYPLTRSERQLLSPPTTRQVPRFARQLLRQPFRALSTASRVAACLVPPDPIYYPLFRASGTPHSPSAGAP